MSKTIVLSVSAAKAFGKLTLEMQERIYQALFSYGAEQVGNVKRMVGTSTSRMRLGNYPVIFNEDANSLQILAVGDRRDIYR